MIRIILNEDAIENLKVLKEDKSKARILKDVVKTLEIMEKNLRHPSLNTHEYKGIKGPQGEKIFEAYAQNNTPGAYREFWYYGPGQNTITVVAIIPHP